MLKIEPSAREDVTSACMHRRYILSGHLVGEEKWYLEVAETIVAEADSSKSKPGPAIPEGKHSCW